MKSSTGQIILIAFSVLMLGIQVAYGLFEEAIKQYEYTEGLMEDCQENLPRNQKCELVITAKVKENETIK